MKRSYSASIQPRRWPWLVAALALVVVAGSALLLAGPLTLPPLAGPGEEALTAAEQGLGLGPRLERAEAAVTTGVVPVGDAEPPPGFFLPAERIRPVDASRLRGALAAAAGRGKAVTFGIHVRDVDSGESLYGRRADEPSLLASNTKIFTTGAALDAFGPGHFLETRLLARGEIGDDGVLRGDLAVVGGGDPTFSWRQTREGDSYAAFRGWAAALRDLGVRRVEGELYLDHGLFEEPRQHPDWDPAKRMRWYQAPVDALAFNENTIEVYAEPASRAGLPARVALRPDLPSFELSSTVLTSPSWKGNRLLVNRPGNDSRITVAGGVYLRARKVDFDITVEDPVAYFGAALAAALGEEGIALDGRPRPVETLPGLAWAPVAVHRTMLFDVVEITNHESQNLFAETLFKLVGARLCGAGNWQRASQAVTELARSVGAEGDGLALHDGSGLSRQNEATPRQVTAFLAGMTRQPFRDAYVASMPTGGEEGTSLEKRLDEAPYPGRFFAKTGTLTGVSTLSGYARGPSGHLYAFSVLTRGGVWQGRQVQDAVVRAIVDHG
jgi:PBP4 family serine-type D-alanyl-D-alanine carboxypeptidase